MAPNDNACDANLDMVCSRYVWKPKYGENKNEEPVWKCIKKSMCNTAFKNDKNKTEGRYFCGMDREMKLAGNCTVVDGIHDHASCEERFSDPPFIATKCGEKHGL